MEVSFTKEDIELVEKFIKIKNAGYYCDGGELTKVYNRILHKNVNSTSCGSCLRQRVNELEAALNYFKELTKKQEELKASNELKKEEVDNEPKEENNEVVEPKKRVGRPKKS